MHLKYNMKNSYVGTYITLQPDEPATHKFASTKWMWHDR